jgi:hypothetical protein
MENPSIASMTGIADILWIAYISNNAGVMSGAS